MSNNLVINGVVFNGVDSIDMMNAEGKEVRYVEEEVIVPGVTVAKIGNVEYDSVEKALAAAVSGDTVTMVANSDETGIIIPGGVTLDLNGFELRADEISSGKNGKLLDNSSANSGKVFVPSGSMALQENNGQLPVRDGDYYVFLLVGLTPNLTHGDGTDTFKFYITKSNDWKTLVNYLADNGSTDHELNMCVWVTWETADANVESLYAYKDTELGNMGGHLTGYAVYSFTNDTDNRTNLKYAAVFTAECGVKVYSQVLS